MTTNAEAVETRPRAPKAEGGRPSRSLRVFSWPLERRRRPIGGKVVAIRHQPALGP